MSQPSQEDHRELLVYLKQMKEEIIEAVQPGVNLEKQQVRLGSFVLLHPTLTIRR